MKRFFAMTFIAMTFLVNQSVTYAQPVTPVFSISANTTTGKPGDVITFTISENNNGIKLDRREFTFDGFPVKWKGKHQWEATPGTHVLRLYLRWIDEDGTKIHRQKYVTVRISGWQKKGGYKHPGLSLSQKILEQIRKNVTGNTPHPMKKAWANFRVPLKYTPQPHEIINMHNIEVDRRNWDKDGHMVYKQALKWAISGDDRYAKNAVNILMAWTNVCQKIVLEKEDVYQFLHATHFMHNWLEAAEILKHYHGGYKGWRKTDQIAFDQKHVRKHLVPLALAWRGNIGNPFGTQNQPLNVAKSRMMLGIYLDDKALFMSGYDHLFKQKLSSRKYKAIFHANPISLFELSIGPNGEYMEVNRDQGHMSMCVASMQIMAEVLWHQDIDMYGMKLDGESRPRFLKGINWLTKAAYGGAPSSNIGTVKISNGRIGAYEKIYNHYHWRLKDKYPLSKQFMTHVQNQRKSQSAKGGTLTHADISKN